MKKILIGILVVSFTVFGLAGQSLAVGFGGYIEGVQGDGEFDQDNSSKFDVDADATSFGFVMDSDLTDKGVFNYRLNVGYEKLDLKDDVGATVELAGLVVANTFGFAIIKKPTFRWWIGPQIRLGFYRGDLDVDSSIDYDLVSLGLGGVTGINFVNDNLCVSTSIGILSTGFAGETDEPGPNRDVDGHTNTVFLNISFLFGK